MLITMNQVTIGIPLYNEEKHIEAAVRSAVDQCSKLIISDNCSTDNSESICRRLSSEFPNISYVRQTANLGAVGNFKYLLDSVDTKYFMWLGAHDAIPQDYVSKLLMTLESEKDAVLAYGNSLHIDANNQQIKLYEYDFAEELTSNDPKNRLLAIISQLGDCSMIHGLFVTKALQQSWEDINYLGGDHVLLAKIALSGKMILNPQTQLYRRQVHINDNLQKQLIRIRGSSGSHFASARKQQMQKTLAGLAKSHSKGLINLYFLKSYYYLIIHFGNFSGIKVLSLAEYIVWNTARLARRLRKVISIR